MVVAAAPARPGGADGPETPAESSTLSGGAARDDARAAALESLRDVGLHQGAVPGRAAQTLPAPVRGGVPQAVPGAVGVMSQQELLRQVVAVLTALHVDYLLTGSLASSAQGEPRSTHDIDLVVALPPEVIPQLAAAFPPPDFYLSADAIRDAVRHR